MAHYPGYGVSGISNGGTRRPSLSVKPYSAAKSPARVLAMTAGSAAKCAR
ncbi:MAG: hypothetical protein M3Z21_16900 [Pseudomonadota bacterium]|nr:hypothetical protein [Pseudomonadota bacterium]